MERDINLLFGVLAVQLRKVTPTQLVDIAGAWATDPSRSLGARLLEVKVLSEADKTLLDGLVAEAIRNFGGDASRTLEAFGGEEEVYHSFRGSVALTDSGGVRSVMPTGEADTDIEELDRIPAVEETPSRYTYVGEHGRGGMGRVLLVHDEILGRDLALKELLPHLAQAKEGEDNQPTPVRLAMPLVARFLREAKITGQLEHPSIVPVYELGYRKDGTLYYTMKLVRGKTLHDAIRACRTLDERLKLLPHFADLCNAIAYAHRHGVIHRDIKPMNVMIGEFGETVVLDWGLAKAKGHKDVQAAAMEATIKAMNLGDMDMDGRTRHGELLGTPTYMPPEQAQGNLGLIDERSDIYSLGAVLYEILTGQPPFTEKNLMQILHKVVHENPKSIASYERRCPPDLIKFCNRAMEKIPEKRYQNAKELADDVEGSKLRPPKSRLKKYAQRAAIFLVLFIPTCTVALNIKSERDLANLKAHYEAQGISMSGKMWEEAPGATEDKPPRTDPLGAIYALEWQFPEYWTRVDRSYWDEIFGEPLSRHSPHIMELDEEDVERMRSFVKEHEDVIQQIRHIAEMPRTPVSQAVQDLITRDGHTWEIPIISLMGMRHCANLLRCEAVVRLHDGDYDGAIESCITMLRFTNHLREDFSLITAMIRVALEGIGCEALQNIISYAEITEPNRLLLQETLASALQEPGIDTGFQGELSFQMDFYETLRSNPGVAANVFSRSKRLRHLAFYLYGSWPLRFWFNGDHMRSIDVMSQSILLAGKPYSEVADDLNVLALHVGRESDKLINYVRYPISNVALPNLFRSGIQFATAETKLKQARLAVALKGYQQANHSFPDDLTDLVPAYLDAVPIDPFTDTPILYQQDANGYTLYGAGEDGEVNLGVLRRTSLRDNLPSTHDITTRILDYYKEANGVWPETWEDLIPEFLHEIPVDFMEGQPYRFYIEDEALVVQRVDKDGNWLAPLRSDDIIWVGW